MVLVTEMRLKLRQLDAGVREAYHDEGNRGPGLLLSPGATRSDAHVQSPVAMWAKYGCT